eukprot:scaffold684_cov345-Pavlova_lutheri.AAC.85
MKSTPDWRAYERERLCGRPDLFNEGMHARLKGLALKNTRQGCGWSSLCSDSHSLVGTIELGRLLRCLGIVVGSQISNTANDESEAQFFLPMVSSNVH